MTDLGSGIEIFLHPGDWYFGDRHTRIRTTLGSCVAVALWHPGLNLGGMCHFLLPERNVSDAQLNPRYGADALELMVQEIFRHKTKVADYEAKLFGGARMLALDDECNSVAERNSIKALELIKEYGLNLVSHSLGGNDYRQLIFNIADGDVWVRQGTTSQSSVALPRHFDFGGAA